MNDVPAITPPRRAPRPRDAATLILLDGKGKNTKILLGRRHGDHKFMPGKFVFPGGRVEACDRSMNVAGALDALVEARLIARRPGVGPIFARALALAAIRETFEETGLALGATEFGPPEKAPAGAWSAYAATGCMPDLQEMHLIARAITPPSRPKRFDTRFFAMDARHIAARVEGFVHQDAELVELVWIGLDKAETLDLPEITLRVLGELRARLAAGMSRFLPVPFFYRHYGQWRRDEL
ncbi:NUDIX domain-containing protein [uncultured Rhodoblastus sp.]|uniref:NUDIX hydrolase n=1 Tax=uncultured Rhodoblastus sp. TaxID=543037 RepID=UPI0025D0CC37|nr:NUDIX domain-containing protein [uncultured Rhodoblastus sp.]